MIFWRVLKVLGSSICNDMKYRCFKLQKGGIEHAGFHGRRGALWTPLRPWATVRAPFPSDRYPA